MCDSCAGPVPLDLELEPNLKVQPEPLRRAEVPGETKSRVGRNAPLAENDLVDAPWRNANVLCEPVLTEAMGLEELGQEHFAGMDRGEFRHDGHLLVVVDDLDVERVGGAPDEADAPLIVDADAVLTGAIGLECFEAVAWRNAKVGERIGRIENDELSKRDALEACRQPARATTVKERFRVGVAEGAYHARA